MEIKDLEIWKPIPQYENIYEVSNKGRVRSLDRLGSNSRYGDMILKGRILKPTTNSWGYVVYRLCKVEQGLSSQTDFKSHRLVAMAFIPNPENKPQVNHLNGVKNDNRVENLEWCTMSENLLHAGEIGLKLYKKGSDIYNAKFTMEDVREIRSNYRNKKESHAKIAKRYNVNKNTILKIVQNLSYAE